MTQVTRYTDLSLKSCDTQFELTQMKVLRPVGSKVDMDYNGENKSLNNLQ